MLPARPATQISPAPLTHRSNRDGTPCRGSFVQELPLHFRIDAAPGKAQTAPRPSQTTRLRSASVILGMREQEAPLHLTTLPALPTAQTSSLLVPATP